MEEFLNNSENVDYKKEIAKGYDFDLKMETTLAGRKVL